MILKNRITIKHSFHSIQDFDIYWECDLDKKVITLNTDDIDTTMLLCWMQLTQLSAINSELKKANLPEVVSLRWFKTNLIVAKTVTFDVFLAKGEATLDGDTLVLTLKKSADDNG